MKSWKTMIVGCAGAAINALIPIIETGTIDPQTLITSITLAVLGVLAKDFDVSGSQ